MEITYKNKRDKIIVQTLGLIIAFILIWAAVSQPVDEEFSAPECGYQWSDC